jgi:hypothetical protein
MWCLHEYQRICGKTNNIREDDILRNNRCEILKSYNIREGWNFVPQKHNGWYIYIPAIMLIYIWRHTYTHTHTRIYITITYFQFDDDNRLISLLWSLKLVWLTKIFAGKTGGPKVQTSRTPSPSIAYMHTELAYHSNCYVCFRKVCDNVGFIITLDAVHYLRYGISDTYEYLHDASGVGSARFFRWPIVIILTDFLILFAFCTIKTTSIVYWRVH